MLYKNRAISLALYQSNLFLGFQGSVTFTEKLVYLSLQVALAQTDMEGCHLECWWAVQSRALGASQQSVN